MMWQLMQLCSGYIFIVSWSKSGSELVTTIYDTLCYSYRYIDSVVKANLQKGIKQSVSHRDVLQVHRIDPQEDREQV